MEELSLLQQGYFQLKQSKFSSAKQFFEEVNAEKEDPSAYIGILLADNCMQEEGQLVELPLELSAYEAYRKAYACAGRGVRNQLDDVEKKQKEVLERKEKKYTALLSDIKDGYKNEEELRAFIGRAVELKNYKNARELQESLKKDLEKLEEEKAKKKSKKKKILIPVIAVVALAVVVFGVIFCLPRRNGVRYALVFGGYAAISKDADLTEVTIEKEINGISVTSIGNKAFKDDENLTKVVLHEGITSIGKSAFKGCKNLEEVKNAEKVGEVKDKAFKECEELRELLLSDGCEISDNAFKGCSEKLKVYAGDNRVFVDIGEDDN